MKISAFFPAYNEEGNITELIRMAGDVLRRVAEDYEIIIVLYEGSRDETGEIVKSLRERDDRIRLVIQPLDDRGYGAALKYGFRACRHPFIFFSDSDNQFNLGELERFVKIIDDCDVVIGYRIDRQDPALRLIAANIYNVVLGMALGFPFRDADCSFKLFRREVMEGVPIRFHHLADGEILARLVHRGCRIKQTGVRHYPRRKGEVVSTIGGGLLRPSLVLAILREVFTLRRELKGRKSNMDRS